MYREATFKFKLWTYTEQSVGYMKSYYFEVIIRNITALNNPYKM